MSRFIGTLTQSGADTLTSVAIDTGITVDGKTGIQLISMEAYWGNAEGAAPADWEIGFCVTTTNVSPTFSSPDEIMRVSWALQNTAGVAIAVPYEPQKSTTLLEPRLTAQPVIYAQVLSSLTGLTNTIGFRIYYETVKLTDVELLRLLVGGA